MFFEKGYQNHTKRTFFSINFTIAKKVSITALYDSYWVLDSIKPWESRVVDIGSLQPRSQALSSCGAKTLVGAGHVTHKNLIA
jgi:hypothetical protein